MSSQSNWRWCNQCAGLFFAGNSPNLGACPAVGGGPHSNVDSGNYSLTEGSGSGQPNWRWCNQCQGLFFAGNKPNLGVCPKTGGHHNSTGSGDYNLPQQPA